MIFLPDSKTGRKPVYLNAPALEVLANLPRQAGNPHVICGRATAALMSGSARYGAGLPRRRAPGRSAA